MEESMSRSKRFLQGVILGGFLGSLTVILLAPGSGDETRSAMLNRLSVIKGQIMDEIENRKKELQEEFERYKNN